MLFSSLMLLLCYSLAAVFFSVAISLAFIGRKSRPDVSTSESLARRASRL